MAQYFFFNQVLILVKGFAGPSTEAGARHGGHSSLSYSVLYTYLTANENFFSKKKK